MSIASATTTNTSTTAPLEARGITYGYHGRPVGTGLDLRIPTGRSRLSWGRTPAASPRCCAH
jgi:hypothetical protein